jgi:hypothetical protein
LAAAVLIVLGLNSLRLKKKPIKRHRWRKIKRNLTGEELQQVLQAMQAHQAAHREPPISVTCLGRHDGAGAQALGVISTLLWAEAIGGRYLHSPFARMDHAVATTGEAWAARWEQFLNLGHGECRVPRGARIIPASDLPTRPETLAKPRTVVASPRSRRRKRWSVCAHGSGGSTIPDPNPERGFTAANQAA